MKLGSRDTHWGEENRKESWGSDDRGVRTEGLQLGGAPQEVWVADQVQFLGLSSGYKDTNHTH